MDTVTESRMAIAIAREGYRCNSQKHAYRTSSPRVDRVKRSEHGVISDPIYLAPDNLVREALVLMERYRISGIPVTVNGKLVGILTNRDLRFEQDFSKKIGDVMTRENLVTAPVGTTLENAKVILQKYKIEKLPIVDNDFNLRGLITIKDIEKSRQFPNSAKDGRGRLLVAAAVGVGSDTMQRVEALVKANVDAIVVDTAHGHSRGVLETVSIIKEKYPEASVIAGNVATAEVPGTSLRQEPMQSGGIGLVPFAPVLLRNCPITAVTTAPVKQRHGIPVFARRGRQVFRRHHKGNRCRSRCRKCWEASWPVRRKVLESWRFIRGAVTKYYRGMGSLPP